MADAYRLEISAFPTATSVIDNFNRADENPISDGGLWSSPVLVGDVPFQVLSNVAAPTSAPPNHFNDSYRNNATFAAVEAWMKISTKPIFAGEGVGIFARVTDPNTANMNGYSVDAITRDVEDDLNLSRYDNGVGTFIGFGIVEVSDGDSIGIRIEGNVLEAWHKPAAGSWTLVVKVVDATYAGPGFIGIATVFSLTPRCDDFGGGVVGAVLTPDRILLEDGTGVLLLEQQTEAVVFRKIITVLEFLKSDVNRG